jgi:triacylglycerol lipase
LQPALDALGISLNGLRNLTTAYCQRFSATYTNAPEVAYFSVAGGGRADFPSLADCSLCFTSTSPRSRVRQNDGLVTVPSALWGKFDLNTWLADHAAEVGTNLDTLGPSSFPWLARYDLIVENVNRL